MKVETLVLDDHRVEPLSPTTWDAFADLVERHNGIFGGCWSTHFHPRCTTRTRSRRAAARSRGDWSRTGERMLHW